MLADFSEVVKPGTAKRRSSRRLPGTVCRGTSRSSWTATGAGPRKGASRALRASRRCRGGSRRRRYRRASRSGALTLYAFSTENWKRPRYEVDALMRMLRRYLRLELDEIDRQDIQFQTIGRTGALAENVRKRDRAGDRTHGEKYRHGSDSGAELWRTRRDHRRLSRRRASLDAKGIAPDELTEERIANELYTRKMPDLDLLVRTSGELRISNFLLWQAAYSEIYVTDTLWPDFRRVHLLEAIVDYQGRDRRFGGLKLVANR